MYIRDQVAEYSRKINLPTIETIIFSVFLPQITLAKTPKHSFTPGWMKHLHNHHPKDMYSNLQQKHRIWTTPTLK